MADRCPNCGAFEVCSATSRTVYDCGSSDYDQRPGTFERKCTGDTFRRNFTGDVAQCGCRWERRDGFGDVLVECPIHQAAGKVLLDRFERSRSR